RRRHPAWIGLRPSITSRTFEPGRAITVNMYVVFLRLGQHLQKSAVERRLRRGVRHPGHLWVGDRPGAVALALGLSFLRGDRCAVRQRNGLVTPTGDRGAVRR